MQYLKSRTVDAREIPFGASVEGKIPNALRSITNEVITSKYTLLTFLPFNTFEQFRKQANAYFLFMSILMYLGEKTRFYIGTIKAFSTAGMLVMMMMVSMFMAATDDIRRHKADDEMNARPVSKLRKDTAPLIKITWKGVRVGDLIYIKANEEIPADAVLLLHSGEESCYVSTANLDGETNLKVKTQAFTSSDVADWGGKTIFDNGHRIAHAAGRVTAEAPHKSIYRFQGSISVKHEEKESATRPLTYDNLLLRGTVLRNTEWCLALVVYTGKDSKIMMNSRPVPMKLSNIEVIVNKTMIVVIIVQSLLALVSDVLFNGVKDTYRSLWYLYPNGFDPLWLPDWLSYWITFFVLYSNLMPVSLYATMEVCNAAHAHFIRNDVNMYDETQDVPAAVRASNLCQELGQVSYLFSDKTGTLTQNIMLLKEVSIDGKVYGRAESLDGNQCVSFDPDHAKRLSDDSKQVGKVRNFLEVLAVSHTVVTSKQSGGDIVYEAESADEEAVVRAVSDCGWKVLGRTREQLTLNVHGQDAVYDILAINKFNSTRKRMSVLVKSPKGAFLLLMKGADNVMFARASKNQGSHQEIERLRGSEAGSLNYFASQGLRTLVVGRRELDERTVNEWLQRYKEASEAVSGREEELEQAADEIEKDIDICGATAIEDKLQDGVPKTISDIREAGVKIWVLTGDALGTAKSIGFSTKLLDNHMDIITIEGLDQTSLKKELDAMREKAEKEHKINCNGVPKITLKQWLDDGVKALTQWSKRQQSVTRSFSQGARGKELALMITGQALEMLNKESGRLVRDLLPVAKECQVVIACRVSPLQKAELVKLVRQNVDVPGASSRPVTLSIGDGANDVPMIQEAQVGVGICGREGRQAVNASDFAIAQFCFLRRLLLVHGRWNYRRASKFVLYTFWLGSWAENGVV